MSQTVVRTSPIDKYVRHDPKLAARFDSLSAERNQKMQAALAASDQLDRDLRRPAALASSTPGRITSASISNPRPSGRRAMLTKAADVSIEKPRFLDHPIMPLGVITLMAGRAGVSKSTLSIDRAAKATLGQLDGDYKSRPVNVAFSGIEDSLSMQKARLVAAGADMNHVMFLNMRDTVNGTSVQTGMTLPDDLPEIRKLLVSGDIRLWILDPITSYIEGNTDKRDDVRTALDPLAALAEDLDIAIVGILHFNKGAGYASDKVSGSHAFRDICRSLLLVAKDDEDGSIIATLDKNNYTLAQGASYSYGLMSVDVTDDMGHTMSVPKVTGFMPSERTVNEVINRNIGQGEQSAGSGQAERGEVIDWLTEYLRDGPASFKNIAAAASDEGYTKTQLDHARRRAKDPYVVTVPDPSHTGRGRSYLWQLSENEQQ